METFDAKLAVVTGGGSGMGRELVVQLAAEGCSVATCDLNETALRETAALAGAGAPDGTRVSVHLCDIADAASVDRFRDAVVAEHEADRIDLLFNNAGIWGGASFVADSREAWERTFKVCWGGVYNCSRAFMPLLMASDDSWLVNTSSLNGFWATFGPASPSTAYSTAKFAVKGFSEALIDDLRAHAPNVKVAVAIPGSIRTGIMANSRRVLAGGDASAEGGGDEQQMLRSFLKNLGVPVDEASDEDLQRLQRVMDETFFTSAAEAATIMLDGIRAGRWRILVGEDAHRIDEAVRRNPDGAYDHDGTGPTFTCHIEHDLLVGLLTLSGLFDARAAEGLTAEYELRVDENPIVCAVVDGRIEIARRGASAPEATLETDPRTFRALVTKVESVDEATARGALRVTGDLEKVEQLLAAVATPEPTGPRGTAAGD